MLSPLKIGKKQFDYNLIQAPLAGVSCAPFRELIWECGGVAYCCTEMLSAMHIASGVDRSPRYQSRSPIEKNLCWQLSGNNPTILAKASQYAISKGADLIDLNCGCPQPKIRKKGCGSQLLSDEKKLKTLVLALKQDASIPVTLKMRIDGGRGEFCEVSLAQMLEESGVDAIIMHGRHWTEDYDVACQHDAIAKVVESVRIPVIGNGDIKGAPELTRFFEQTHCAGFMIGRASVGQPWLFQKIICDMLGQSFDAPSNKIIGALFLKHVSGLIALDGERTAIYQSRKFGKYYARLLHQKADFLNALYEVNTIGELKKVVEQFL